MICLFAIDIKKGGAIVADDNNKSESKDVQASYDSPEKQKQSSPEGVPKSSGNGSGNSQSNNSSSSDDGNKKSTEQKAKQYGIKGLLKKIGQKLASLLGKSAALAKVGALLQLGSMAAVTGITSLASTIAGTFSSIVSAVTGTVGSVVSTVAATFGTSMAAAGTMVASGALAVTVGAVGFVSGLSNSGVPEPAKDEYYDCATQLSDKYSNEDVDADATELEMAKAIYSIMSYNGIPDKNIAGAISNMAAECHLDPTAVEAIFTEPYDLGPEKLEAVYGSGATKPKSKVNWNAIDHYTRTTMRARYGSYSLNWDFYCSHPPYALPGIGLTSCTGENCYQFLTAAEEVDNGEWYTIEFATAHMFAYHAQGIFANGVGAWTEEESSATDAAVTFFRYWEGGASFQMYDHIKDAESWYSELKSWEVDTELGESAKDLIEKLGTMSGHAARHSDEKNCISTMSYDNSDIAHAAVSYAYATEPEGNGNNGTELYIQVHDTVYPNDGWYMSCDRGVACAVKWSGSDDDFPAGHTGAQLSYMLTSDKWEEIDFHNWKNDYDKLEPGDVFCCDGHIYVFVGKELIEEMHGGAATEGSDIVSASFCERSPGCGIGEWCYTPYDTRPYQVFRCVKPDNSNTYADAGAGAKPASTLKGSVYDPKKSKAKKDKKSSDKDKSKSTSSTSDEK